MEYFKIISEVSQLSTEKLERLANALTIQAQSHLYPLWAKSGKVEVLKQGESLPTGYIPIYIQYDIDTKGQNGYHWQDADKKPFVKIKYNPDFDQLCLTTSHEVLETIINPNIDKFKPSEDLQLINNRGEEFFEICDVTQAKEFSYRIDGIMVSNFVTTNYYIDKLTRVGVKYDYLGYVKSPGEILDGGYKSWRLNDKEVLQAFKVQGVLIYKRVTGDKIIEVSANSAPLTWIIPSIVGFLIFMYFFFKRK